MPPGTYCGGIEGKTHGVITLQKGIYVLKDGDLKLDAGSEIHATAGTIIYLTGTSSNIDITSGAVVEIIGPNKSNNVSGDSTYAYRGWAILQDRATTPTTSNTHIVRRRCQHCRWILCTDAEVGCLGKR